MILPGYIIPGRRSCLNSHVGRYARATALTVVGVLGSRVSLVSRRRVRSTGNYIMSRRNT